MHSLIDRLPARAMDREPWCLRLGRFPAVALASMAMSLALGTGAARAAEVEGEATTGELAPPAAEIAPLQLSRGDGVILEAREALRVRSRDRLAAARTLAMAAQHPLAQWVEYFELRNRLEEATQEEFAAFSARWRGSYVEDRLRNDWLRELGRRRDWGHFASEYPRFRMDDDHSVRCYHLLLRRQAGEAVVDTARTNWLDYRHADDDDGCGLMAEVLLERGDFTTDDAWFKARQATEARRLSVARHAVGLVSPLMAAQVAEIFGNPARYLARRHGVDSRTDGEMAVLALTRLAAKDPRMAATLLDAPWREHLRPDQVAWLWASIARSAARELLPEADAWFQRSAAALSARSSAARAIELADDTLAWKARAALRAGPRWPGVLQAVAAMDEAQRAEPTWIYWRARAMQALAAPGADGEAQRVESRRLLGSIASGHDFYGRLAAEELTGSQPLPAAPLPPSAAERAAVASHPGLTRALALIELGLRSEGVREWNFSLRGMDDRQLLAAAQRACDAGVWDRCISTSERTQAEIDMAQRYPLPYRDEVVAAAREAGLDPALVYGLIRQESRFVSDARSGVGASGLMQLMPATARIVARKIGLDDYHPRRVNDRATNLRLGTSYLRMVLDDFQGSMALATAAYNAGPGRSRRWREGPVLEVAIWAENIPFSETRGYVKNVLRNAVIYQERLGRTPLKLRDLLGDAIGPRAPDAPAVREDLP